MKISRKEFENVTQYDMVDTIIIIEKYAAPGDLREDSEIMFQAPDNITNSGKVMTIIAKFLLEVTPLLFKNGKFKSPSWVTYGRITWITIKMILSLVHSLINKPAQAQKQF